MFCRCRGLVYALHLEVPQVQLFFKDVDFPVVAQRFCPMVQTFRPFLMFLPVAVHVVVVPVVQLLQVPQVQF